MLPSVIQLLQAPEDLLIAEQDPDSVNVDHSENMKGEQASGPVSGTAPHTTDEPKTEVETIAEAWWQQPKYRYDAQYDIFHKCRLYGSPPLPWPAGGAGENVTKTVTSSKLKSH